MAEKPMSQADAQKMFDDAVRILREDAVIAQNKALLARLDSIDTNTRKVPQTPEEKAAAYDALMAKESGKSSPPARGNEPPNPTQPPQGGSGQPTPPNQKPPGQSQETKPDWWWGDGS